MIAHRGGRHDGVPGEQTLAHAERAIALGADFVEIDLRHTSDGELVCVHDPVHAGVTVGEVPYADLVRASAAAGGVAPPRFREMLATCRGRIRLDVELKVAGVERQVLDEARRALPADAVVFKSFQDAIVRELKRIDPTCVAGLLLGVSRPRWGVFTRLAELFPGWRLRACHADFVCPNQRLLQLGFAARLRAQGYPVLVWTVNDPAAQQALLDEVDGLVTDEAAACLALRRRAV